MAPRATTIHAVPGRSVARFQTGETLAATLDGFTLTGGAPDSFAVQGDRGAGIFVYGASPTIVNNVITGNAALYGGGMYCRGRPPCLRQSHHRQQRQWWRRSVLR